LKPFSAQLEHVPKPLPSPDALLVRTLALGVCATDREIVSGEYGTAPPGETRLILGHESLGEVEEAPAGSGFSPGDLVVGIVRRPDPVPCAACAAGEWDMCQNGRYVERGIKERNGFGAEWFTVRPQFAIKIEASLADLGVLLEPSSILAKAWEQILRIGERSRTWRPQTVLIIGAGPIGLLAAMMGVQSDLQVHVYDHHEGGVKPSLAEALGATYHSHSLAEAMSSIKPDVVIECTGAPSLLNDILGNAAADGIVCLAGVSGCGRMFEIDLGRINREMVLNNQVVFGTVNANRRHYERAAQALYRADPNWLRRLITRRVPLERWSEALDRKPDDIKVVIDFSQH
jgi:threonine dehydrogenase-like Zn-dependent dehydrogenase